MSLENLPSSKGKIVPLFGTPKFYKESLAIAVPVMLQQLIMSLVSLIDNFMVAGLGDASMAAVNVANQVNFVYFVVCFTLCGAGGIYISQYNGAKDPGGMRQAFRFKLFMTLAVSCVYLFLCQAIPEKLLSLMTSGNASQAEIVERGSAYMRIVSIMWVPISVSTSIGTAFREMGKPKISLVVSVAATLVNTFFNWVLIYGNLGAPRLEVEGAAIATNIARAVELLAYLLIARFDRPPFLPELKRLFRVDIKIFKAIVGKSWMMLLSESTWVLSETLLTALYNGRGGAEVVAGMASGFTIANLLFLVFPGIHTATGVIVGGALGADKLGEAREKARWIISGAVVFGLAMGIIGAMATLIIPLVFGNLSPDARAVTRGLVFVIAAYFPSWALLNAQFAVSRSGGDTAMGMWVDVGVTVCLVVPIALVLAEFSPIGPVALFAVVKVTDFIKASVAGWWLKKERWLKNLTIAQ